MKNCQFAEVWTDNFWQFWRPVTMLDASPVLQMMRKYNEFPPLRWTEAFSAASRN
jgi:hypothetical protein